MGEAEQGARRLTAAMVGVVVATVAFAAYARTLLPGVDLGDTGGFQAAVLWPETSARRAYPLYYALAKPFVLALSPSDPARGLNFFSAVSAAAAVGLLTFVASLVVRSAIAGAAAGLLLAFSYTFWTQAIIAEVYALHLALVALSLLALHHYAERPTTMRLAVFFAVYAVAFGNHLGMILLLVPFTAFLVWVQPRPHDLLEPRIAALAAAFAAAGALIYLPDLLWVWTHADAPPAWRDRLAAFWFDVTKADWRDAMILEVDAAALPDRLAMWLWDARQQFGIVGLLLVTFGAVRLWTVARPWAILVWTAYAISTLFALTYNVGDPHVFFLPGHFLMAFAAAGALALVWPREPRRRRVLQALAVVALLYPAWRAWDTWPLVDRHGDARADVLVARLTAGVDESNAILLSQMEWQAENALLYAARHDRREVAWTRLPDVMLHLPFLVRDNHAIGRDVVLAGDAAADVLAAYGPLFSLARDPWPPAPPFSAAVARIPRGAPYVLSLLTPTREAPLDPAEFAAALSALGAATPAISADAAYQVWAGIAGEPPAYYWSSERPFRETFSLRGHTFTVRLNGWLPFDVFRRGGFGRVLLGREPILIVERGASLVWLDGDGSAVAVYSGGLYEPKPRFRIPASIPQGLAGMRPATLEGAAPLK